MEFKDSHITDLETTILIMKGFKKQRNYLIKFILELRYDIRKGLPIDKKLEIFIEDMHDNLQKQGARWIHNGNEFSPRLKELLSRIGSFKEEMRN